MYCRNCGKEVEDDKELCDECKEKETTKTEVNEGPVNVVKEVKNSSSESFGKSKMAAGLFGIFLGAFGVHNFYLGYTGKAVIQLLMTICSCGFLSPVSAIWGLIEGILILSGDINKDAEGNSLRKDL
jgi:hypothetical protein